MNQTDTRDRRYFVFLRAINTGKRRLTNEQLVAPFEQLGLSDVAAYQAAGNVTFRSARPNDSLTDRLETALAEAYGFTAHAFLRSGEDLQAIADAEPFTRAELAPTEERIQVAFMKKAVSDDEIAEVAMLVPPADRLSFGEWIDWSFGAGISRHFMRPYNRKMWGVDLDEMSAEWTTWSVPVPTLEEGTVWSP